MSVARSEFFSGPLCVLAFAAQADLKAVSSSRHLLILLPGPCFAQILARIIPLLPQSRPLLIFHTLGGPSLTPNKNSHFSQHSPHGWLARPCPILLPDVFTVSLPWNGSAMEAATSSTVLARYPHRLDRTPARQTKRESAESSAG